MKTLGVAEAKRSFSELLDRVRRGERFVLQRRGRAAAALVPVSELRDTGDASPAGVLGLVGALADIDGFDDIIADVIASRRSATDRPAPELPG